MAITIDWGTKVISVPKADLTFISGLVYELDVDEFRLRLKDLEDDEAGMPFIRTHNHNTTVLLSGVVYARSVEILNGYTVTFEDGQYAVKLVGANHNIADVINVNQVSIQVFNSAGLIETATSGLTTDESTALLSTQTEVEFLRKIMGGRRAVISQDDETITFYDDDNVGVIAVYSVSADGRLKERTA